MQIPKRIDGLLVTDLLVGTREIANIVNKINEIIDYLESSQSSGECDHIFDKHLLSNPPTLVCSRCGVEQKSSQPLPHETPRWIQSAALEIQRYSNIIQGIKSTNYISSNYIKLIILEHYNNRET